MSIRNYLSAREKRYDCLPSISHRSRGSELPPVSGSISGSASRYNRNIYAYDQTSFRPNSAERTGTPFSDFFSESESGTPDFRSEESDSSAGSALRRSNAEATRALYEEWESIERTMYDEEGKKCTRAQIVEECKQWRALHPQLRVVGRAISLPEKRPGVWPQYDEMVDMHYSDKENPSESEEERVSQSSTDVTPQNSPRPSTSHIAAETKVFWENNNSPELKLNRQKINMHPISSGDDIELPDSFRSLLQITPLNIRSPTQRKRQNASILKSEIASSKWMKNSRPDSSANCDRNSAKSFVSLDTRNYGKNVMSASEHNKMFNSRVLTARHRDIARLEPLCTPELPQNNSSRISTGKGMYQYNMRKVSLPPLMLEEEKKKVVHSAKKQNKSRKNFSKNSHHLDRMRCNK